MYAAGKGVPQDPVLALTWLNLASPRSAEARRTYDALAALAPADLVAEAQRMPGEWKPLPRVRPTKCFPPAVDSPSFQSPPIACVWATYQRASCGVNFRRSYCSISAINAASSGDSFGG